MCRRALLVAVLAVLTALSIPDSVGAVAVVAPPGKSAGDSDATFVYSDLLAAVRRHQVPRAVIDQEHGEATVWLAGHGRQKVPLPPGSDLADRLSDAGARVEVKRSGNGPPWRLLVLGVAVLVIAGGWLLTRGTRARAKPGGGASGASASPATRPAVRFDDVAGCEEAVEELREFVTFLRDPARFDLVGARMPSGLLLHGPPGTGKTLLAKALAGEAEVSFFASSGSDFMDRYVGVGASRVRQLFSRARREASGAVVFIDELDAIGKRRSSGGEGVNTEGDHTLNQLLVELDGFESSDRLICIAATNRMDVLDPALLRPGRLSRHVLIDLPPADGRRAILDVHTRGKPLAADVDLDRLAEGTAGCSGADLADLINEGAIIAARADRTAVTQADLEEGHLRVLAGPAKRRSPLSAVERKVVAHHEAGHALVAEFSATCDRTHRLTIRPRGRAAGLAVPARRDRSLHSTRHVHEQLMVLLGGRAAEQVVYGRISSGAANDLQQANMLARRAVTEFGFSPRAGQLVDSLGGRMIRLAETTHQVIDEEVNRMIAEAYRDAIVMVADHRKQLDRLAGALLVSVELDRDEIAAALGEPAQRPARRPAEPQPELVPRRADRATNHGAAPRLRVRRRLRPALAAARTMLAGGRSPEGLRDAMTGRPEAPRAPGPR